MTEKRYQVFISSTYEDLKEERSKVIQALLGRDCIPTSMENFNAANEDQFTVIKELISSCDYYVLIIGGRYGSIEPNSGKSYTQLEYEYANSIGIPTIAFYYDNINRLQLDRTDDDPQKKTRLLDFIEQVKKKLCKSWDSPSDLALNVVLSLDKLFKTHPRKGWVRGDTISSAEANQKIIELQKTNESLRNELEAFKKNELFDKNKYQQHCDIINITVVPKNGLYDNPFGINLKVKPFNIALSWDETFKAIASSFFSPVQTNLAADMISQAICNYKGYDDSNMLDGNSCNTILTQFYALGYLGMHSSEVYMEGIKSYYVITELGMNTYVGLMAKKK